MKRNVGTLWLMLVVLMALIAGATPLAAKQPLAVVNARGTALMTYTGTDLPPGPQSAKFKFEGNVRDNGSANGHVRFTFTGAGAADWGAVPGVQRMELAGKVSEGTVDPNGTVKLRGILTETDYLADGSVGFQSDEPFVIQVGGDTGSDRFVLQWCLLAPFDAEVTEGRLKVQTPGVSGAFAAAIAQPASTSCER